MTQKSTDEDLLSAKRARLQAAASQLRANIDVSIDQLILTTSSLWLLLDAVACGATLEIQGQPDGSEEPFRASLTRDSRFVDVTGNDVQSIVCSLAKAWKK